MSSVAACSTCSPASSRRWATGSHRSASRLERLPEVLDGARATLVGVDGRPVGRFQTETALKQLPGIGALIDDALGEAETHPDDPAVAAVTPRLAGRRGNGPGRDRRVRDPPA